MIFLAGGHLATVADEVVRRIRRFTAPPESDLEAGGILLGCRRGPHVEVLDCTEPMRLDRRTRYSFVRRDPGHQRAALAAWNTSGRTVNFVGEWHTHPEETPSPSRIDRNTWADVMRHREAEAQIFMIAGHSAFYCALGLQGRLTKMGVVAGEKSLDHRAPVGSSLVSE
jgi:integrative and conjugative element protein (TIGR02256 family)